MSSESARAVAEVAKTAGEVVKAAGGVGSYLAGVFSSIPQDALGLMVGDWLNHKRRRNLAQLEANTARILEGIDRERLTEPSPSVLIPLLQAAVDEDRAELQALWATLLANVMIDGGHRVRRSFFDVIRQLEPADAFVLDLIRRSLNRDAGDDRSAREAAMQFLRNEAADAGISANSLEVSLDALGRSGCVQPRERGGPPPLSAFGLAMLDACTVR